MITFSQRGSFKHVSSLLEKYLELFKHGELDKYGQMGIDALKEATPKRTGKTADSWTYEIQRRGNGVSIVWKNSNRNKNENIAALIQFGHGNGNGAYIQGRDYINPAIQPIFDQIAEDLGKEVAKFA